MSNYDIEVVGKSTKSLGDLCFTKLKDKTKQEHQTHIVYEVKCSNCDAMYVGQTSQHLCARAKQHIRDSKNFNKTTESALSKHLRSNQHEISVDNFKVLKKENNTTKRRIYEMLCIKQKDQNKIINLQKDTEYLQHSYDHLI